VGGSGSRQGTSTVVSSPAPAQIPPQFQPFAQQVGNRATQNLDLFNLQDYSGNNALQVPGLNPLQTSALNRVQDRFDFGIPTPQAETQLGQNMSNASNVSQQQVGMSPFELLGGAQANALPDAAGQRVATDPTRAAEYNQAQNLSGQVGQPVGATPWESQGANTLSQFANGDLGNSPAIQSAASQIAGSVIPQVQNQMTKQGLGRSGAMDQELQSRMAGTLLPLYMQGLQQQQSAGGQLAGLGTTVAGRQENAANRAMQMQQQLQTGAQNLSGTNEALDTSAINRMMQAVQQSTIPTMLGLGGNQATRQGDTINRQLAATSAQYYPQLQTAQAQQGREQQSLQDMLSGGALDRDIAGQQAQSQQADMLRRQALAETFGTAMLGSIPSLTTFPQSSTDTYRTPATK
jgi:hypothetical protein